MTVYHVTAWRKNGEALSLTADIHGSDAIDTLSASTAMDIMRDRRMAWHYDFELGEYRRAKIGYFMINDERFDVP